MKALLAVIVLLALFGISFASHAHHGETKNDTKQQPLCANGKVISLERQEENRKSLETCRLKREDVIAVFRKGFDISGDGWFTPDECEKARGFYLKWYERALASTETCAKVFEHCDCDGDGRINEKDFEDAKNTCLRNCDTLVMIDFFIGSRMKGNAFEGVKDENE